MTWSRYSLSNEALCRSQMAPERLRILIRKSKLILYSSAAEMGSELPSDQFHLRDPGPRISDRLSRRRLPNTGGLVEQIRSVSGDLLNSRNRSAEQSLRGVVRHVFVCVRIEPYRCAARGTVDDMRFLQAADRRELILKILNLRVNGPALLPRLGSFWRLLADGSKLSCVRAESDRRTDVDVEDETRREGAERRCGRIVCLAA